MKTFFVLTMLAFSSFSFSSTIFDCTSLDGMWIQATVEIIDEQNYEVSLRNEYDQMPVHQKEISFDESGEMISIRTSALWESFSIYRSEGKWTGHYWYDNSQSLLSCKEIK